jgi:hypothetical protein
MGNSEIHKAVFQKSSDRPRKWDDGLKTMRSETSEVCYDDNPKNTRRAVFQQVSENKQQRRANQIHRRRIPSSEDVDISAAYGMVTKPLTRKDSLWSDSAAIEARRAEVARHSKNTTWDAQPLTESQARRLYPKAKITRLHMLLGLKNHETPSLMKFKARLVALGNLVRTVSGEEPSWEQISSLPSDMSTLRSVISLALERGSVAQGSDCVSAYVQAWLAEEDVIFAHIDEAEWTEDMALAASKLNTSKVLWRLRRPIYGLPSSGAEWAKHLHQKLVGLGYRRAEGSTQLWFHEAKGIWLAAYVDDLIMAADAGQYAAEWKRIGAEIELTPAEPVSRLLGVGMNIKEVQYNGERHMVWTQDMEGYLDECLRRYEKIAGAPPLKNATSPGLDVTGAVVSSDEMRQPGFFAPHAASLTMSLAYCARMCRGDLCSTVNELASQLTKWTRLSDLRLCRLFGYVRATKHLKLHSCIKISSAKNWSILGFADANLADADACTRSTSGSIVYISDNKSTRVPIGWNSGKQTATALSTAEAELVALTRYLQTFLLPLETLYEQLLHRPIASTTGEDNTACISCVRSGFSSALRYMAKSQRLSIGFAHEVFSVALRRLTHVKTTEQCADAFTKSLSGEKLHHAWNQLGLAADWDSLNKAVFFQPV